MSFNDILDKVAKLPPRNPLSAEPPPPELVAFFVRSIRNLRQLKRETLASIANVSISTVERIERGERVSTESPELIEIALGYDKGYLTAPRLPLSEEEAMRQLVERYGEMDVVSVRPLRTQRQVRELAHCHAFLPHCLDTDEYLKDEIMGLVEWLDLASFLLSEDTVSEFKETGNRRKLYADILSYVRGMEKRGFTVLAGVMPASHPGIPEWKVAVISVCPRSTDPGAIKRRNIFVDRRCVAPGNYAPFPGDEP